MMRPYAPGVGSVVLCALAGLAGAQPSAPAPMYRLPVNIIDCGGHPGGRAPAALIGTLFTGGYVFREYDADRLALAPADQLVPPCPCTPNKHSPVITEYLLGNVRPRPSAKDEDTSAFLMSPPLSNGFDGGVGVGGFEFTVDALTLQGNEYTATTTYWRDNSPQQWGPGPLRKGMMLRLSSPGYGPGGWLRPGEYTFRLISRELFMPVVPGGRPLYQLVSTKVGTTKFTVVDGEPWDVHTWDQAPSKAVIEESALKADATLDDAALAKLDTWPRWQPPVFAQRRADGKGLRPEQAERRKDGSRELALTFAAQAPGAWKHHAQPAKPLFDSEPAGEASALDAASGIIVARVSGVEWDHRVAPADKAELLSVEWTASEEVTLRIGLWRRSQADERTQIPELAVPLETRGLSGSLREIAERLKVRVVWDEL